MRLVTVFLAALLVAGASLADDPATYDQRFGVVATDTSGWNGPVMPMQGPQFFDPLNCAWWYNYSPNLTSNAVAGLTLFWPGYQRLYMFWTLAGTYTDAQIQALAAGAKAADPTRTIWWAMSNEPNDRGQANEAASTYPQKYLKFHKNLRIGDPTCKIIGPGLLDWRFTNASCYQTGKNWYTAFRNAWAADPACVAYSQSVNGTNYPPQDGFSLHSYHLGWGTGIDDWRWCRDDMQACYDDLQTFPETAGLKIWNTEYGSLITNSLTAAADMMSGLTLWMRDQPWMERWFLFFTRSDRYATFHNCELFDANGQPNQLAKAYQAIAKLPDGASFTHYPYTFSYDQTTDYIRPGWTQNNNIGQRMPAPGVKFYLTQGTAYPAQSMRARKFAPQDGAIYKVAFNYRTNYDNAKCVLAMDTSAQTNAWQVNKYGTSTDYVEIDLSANPVDWISLGLLTNTSFTYGQPTEEWHALVSNITLYTCPKAPTVTDEGAITSSANTLSAQWTTTGGAQPIVDYEYAIGTAPGLANITAWESVGPAQSVERTGLNLISGTTYYFSVRAKDAQGHWSPKGYSDGIRKTPPPQTISEAKLRPLRSYVILDKVVVSSIFAGRFYVQNEDRSAGIAVVSSAQVQPGDRVAVAGPTDLVNGELVVTGTLLDAHPGAVPTALTVNNYMSGGESFGAQPALLNDATSNSNAVGLSNVGLLVTLSGRVTSVDSSGGFFYLDDGSALDDGSGPGGVRVQAGGLALPEMGAFVRVTGAMGATLINGKPVRLLRAVSSDAGL